MVTPPAELIADALGVPSPEDYFKGRCANKLVLPDNVLLFARHSGSLLARHPAKNFHHRHILLVPLQGKGRVIVNERAYPIGPGDVLMVQPFQFHHYMDIEESIAWLFITYDQIEPPSLESPLHRVTDPTFWSDLKGLIGVYQKGAQENNTLVLRLALLLEDLRHGTKPVRRQFSSDSGGAEQLLLQIQRLVLRNRQNPLFLKELAAHLGYSESHLRAKFRQATGYSLGQFQRTIRLQHAAQLLSQGEWTISEVSEMCGWDTPFSFSRAFRAYWGMSPRNFMRRNA